MKKNNSNLSKKVHNILIVDDEKDELEALYSTLENAEQIKCNIITAENSIVALAKLEKSNIDIILTDFNMPQMDGIELLNKVKDKYPNTIRLLITAWSDFDMAKKAINKAGIHHLIEKPWSNDELINIIQETLIKKNKQGTKTSTEVDNAEEALRVVHEANQKLNRANNNLEIKQRIMLEFMSQAEFNKFFFTIKQMKNVNIDDIHIFENKYVMKLSLYRRSLEKIL